MGKWLLPFALVCGLFFEKAVFAQQGRVLNQAGIKKLSVFLGTWKASSTDGKISAVSTGSWSANGDFLVVEQVVDNNGKKSNNLSIFQYNPTTDDYTLTVVGIPTMAPFTVPLAYRGDTLIFYSEWTEHGAKKYNRTLNIFSSATDYRYIIQNSADSTHWETAGEGESEKVGGR